MILGGVVYHDPARRMGVEVVRAMAGGRSDAAEPAWVGCGPFGVFVTGSGQAPVEHPAVVLAADADLLNLTELQGLTGREDLAGVIARLYEREGAEAVRRLRGGFALALWDRGSRQLLLAVDQFGIRRLHYAVTPEGFAFASRASALLALPGTRREAEPTSLYHYLNLGFVPAPRSIFPGIFRLPPGHQLIVRDGRPQPSRYWDLTYTERPLSVDESAAATARLAQASVALALEGASPKATGAFLSGGTDSSTVLGLMRKLTGERVNAFSIGFQEERYNELDHAELAARHFDAAHYVHVVTPAEALAALPSLVEAYDEPFGNDSAIGTLLCARLARSCGVTRLLAGDGGDEIFGGNQRYATDHLFARYQRIPGVLRRGLVEPVLLSLREVGLVGKAQRYIRRANIPNPRRFYFYELFFAQDGQALLDPEFVRALEPDAPWALIEEHFRRAPATAELNRLLYLDMKLAIGDNDLLKVTRTGEVAGVDVRFPFLDLPLVEFTATWPARFKVRGVEKRYLFKRAFRPLLPPATLAKRKHGFGVPTSAWLKTHAGFAALAQDSLRGPDCRVRPYFRAGAIEQLFALHAQDPTPFYGGILWGLLMLELWHRRHLSPGVTA
ncbi:MAG: asparagine synthase-related protein [Candidatus Rokuibacteriota bacterium]